jgi:DNA-binding SARP family transcriptional activator
VLRLFLVGRLAASYDDEPLPVPPAERVRAMIGWLGLHPGVSPRSTVAAALWPDADEDQIRARLRTAVWTLRRAWEPAVSVLIASRDGLGFAADKLVTDALAPPDAGSPLPEGLLLPGIEDDWAEQARQDYRDKQIRRLRVLAEQAEKAGSLSESAHWARRRCVLSPWDEAAHRDLIRLLAATGDRAAAADEARRFTARLRDELGIEPSAATRSAHAMVAQGAVVPRRSSLYGRAADLRALGAAWRAAAGGHGRVVLLSGEAGIGKTTLLAEFCRRVSEAGARVGSGSGLDVGGSTPFAAWLDIARMLMPTIRPVPAGQRWPAELNRLAPDLGAALGRDAVPAAVATPELERLRVLESALRLVEWAAAERPLLLTLDDAHQADRSTLQLMAHLSRRLSGLPVLIVLAGRDRPRRVEIDELTAATVRAG